MGNRIAFIPEVPDEIKGAVNDKSLAVFIGAGVSRLVGCDGWDNLARNLLDRCFEDRVINHKEHETLSHLHDHKKIITICHHLLEDNGASNIFYGEMKKSLRWNESVATPNIYDGIFGLRGLFITTNADSHFDRLFNPPNILYDLCDFKGDRLDATNLYHIHGSVADEGSLIFTVSQYIKRYTNPDFKQFLSKIFREYTVLFLGYGLSEFEILDYVLLNKSSEISLPNRHFMLSPFFRGEDNIVKHEQSYYSELGITLLGYEKDDNGYGQLNIVIDEWNKEINLVTDYLHSASRIIDEAVE